MLPAADFRMQNLQSEGRTPDGPTTLDDLTAEAGKQILHIVMRRLLDQPAPNPVNPIHRAHTCLAMMIHLTIPVE
jgi:hypothetical protein